jgi:hypothetical protein
MGENQKSGMGDVRGWGKTESWGWGRGWGWGCPRGWGIPRPRYSPIIESGTLDLFSWGSPLYTAGSKIFAFLPLEPNYFAIITVETKNYMHYRAFWRTGARHFGGRGPPYMQTVERPWTLRCKRTIVWLDLNNWLCFLLFIILSRSYSCISIYRVSRKHCLPLERYFPMS